MPPNHIIQYINSFIDLVFPNLCGACENPLSGNEDIICTECLTRLPLTNFWNQPENMVEQLFWGRAKVELATSFIYFDKDSRFQHALHQLKYKGKKQIGVFIGKIYGNYLIDSRFKEIDIIIPVPLHKKRLQKRGYNQSEMIAKGISESLKKPLETNSVKRVIHTTTQTKKNRYSRWQNVEGIFKCSDIAQLQNKHVLIVDDVVTTGATIESLAQELIKIKGVKVSVATIAVA